MKIVIAVHHYPPRYTGGGEWEAYRLARHLQARQHDVRVVCVERIDAGAPGTVTGEEDVHDGIPVRRLSFNLAAAPDPGRWEYDNPWIGEYLDDFLRAYRPDVFQLIGGYLMTISALRAARQLGIPTVLRLTDFWFLCPRILMQRSNGQLSTLPLDPAACARCLGEQQRRYRLPGRIAPKLMDAFWRRRRGPVQRIETRMRVMRDALNQIDAIVSPSQFLRAMHIEAGLDPERISFQRQGLDLPDALPAVEKVAAAADGLRVGYIGQIAPHKGVHVLFDAVRRLPSARLVVRAYGDPGHFPAYAARLRRAAAHDHRLELAGVFRSLDGVSRVFQEIDVMVVPSVWYENSPNVILEAFAHGTPVIASDLGGMAELVHHGNNGLLFTPGDARSLARCLEQLSADPQLLATLRAGIPRVKSMTEAVAEMETIYASVIRNRRRGGDRGAE